VRALLATHPRTQIVVCDDGLQHLALARDIEICVFDERGTGNGRLLPAGPLREPWPRPADFILDPSKIRRTLAGNAVRGDGTRCSLADLRGQAVHAVAGIARPVAFFDMLRGAGVQIGKSTALPDHDDFSHVAFDPADVLVCTEKDAVKLWRVRPDAWAVPLEVMIDESFWRAFDAKLSSWHGPQTA
jgi:tetraacyldisaccharide 4'-kinase